MKQHNTHRCLVVEAAICRLKATTEGDVRRAQRRQRLELGPKCAEEGRGGRFVARGRRYSSPQLHPTRVVLLASLSIHTQHLRTYGMTHVEHRLVFHARCAESVTLRRAARRQSCSQDSHIPIMPMYVCYNMNHVYLQIRNKMTTRPSLRVTNTPGVSAEIQPEPLSRPTRHRCKHPQRLALRIGLHIRPRPSRAPYAIPTANLQDLRTF